MEYSVKEYDDKTVVTLENDRLDAAMAVRFKDALKNIVEEGVDNMVLDMTNIGFMDSSGLGAIVAHMKFMGPEKNFEIACLNPSVDKVFKLTRMDKVFTIHKSLDDAVSENIRAAG